MTRDLTADPRIGEGLKPSSRGAECHSGRIRLVFQGEMTLFLNLLPSSTARSVGGHRLDVINM